MNIGKAIREMRKRECMNQQDYASRIGVTQTYLSQIENGHKKPSMEVLEAIASDLKTPLSVVFWFALSEEDVIPSKVQAYRMLKPAVDELINYIIKHDES